MASLKIIRRRIKSAQNIAQITRAMEMVAASKMKKAQEKALMGRAYADKIYDATRELAGKTEKTMHPLLSEGNPKGKKLIIVISTTKGLCGGLNTNLFREINVWFPKNSNHDYISVGKKGENYIIRSGRKLAADFSDKVTFSENVAPLTQLFVDGFIKGIYSEVYLTYNAFINVLKQTPTKRMILPIVKLEEYPAPQHKESKYISFSNFTIEPSVEEVLDNLIPHYLENQLRSSILEAEASEHSARMIAMRNATDAALDLMEGLTLVMNKVRQEKITYEIADTVTARMAIES